MTRTRRWSILLAAIVSCSAAISTGQEAPGRDDVGSERPAFRGMDESVNETLAEEAGLPSRDPLINTQTWGELWNLLLLVAGGACGFIVGRYWDQIWGVRPGARKR